MVKTSEIKQLMDFHEEFDYFFNPSKKSELLKLRENLNKLPPDERLYEVENYAVRNGVRKNPLYEQWRGEGKNHKCPTGGSVVMPAYGRLLNAYKWLQKLEEYTVDKKENATLPF